MRFGLCSHPLLGHASIAVTDVEARTASLNAVPDRFTIYLDRRTTLDETRESTIGQVRGLIADYMQEEIVVEELFYDTPSYTGFVFPVDKYFPAWAMPDDHPLVQAGQRALEALVGGRAARHVGFLPPTACIGRGRPEFRRLVWGRATRRRRTR